MKSSLQLTERRTLLATVDLVLVNVSVLLALWIAALRGPFDFDSAYLIERLGWFPFLSAFWVFSAFLNDFYNLGKASDFRATGETLIRTVSLIWIAYLLIYFGSYPNALQRGIVIWQGLACFVLVSFWRGCYILLAWRPAFARCVLIIGAGWAGQTIADAIHRYAKAHYQILGFIDDDVTKRAKTVQLGSTECYSGGRPNSKAQSHYWQLPVLGMSSDLLPMVKEQHVPEVILAVTQNLSTPLFQALLGCKEQGVQITLMPVLFEQLTGQVPIEHIGDNWNVALPLDSAETGGFYPIFKRLFDVTGALVGLLLFSILFPFIAFAIRIDSPGPIFYTQERVGKGGRIFNLLKLRTMVSDAEREGHAMRASTNDPRITRVGRLLRKMRLDEMPQLINILKGDMSAVGPRPERPEHLQELDRLIPFHRLRNAVKPGMAGWAVVNYDYVDSVEDARIRLQYDLYYIKHQSIWLDLVILLRTMGHMLMLKGR